MRSRLAPRPQQTDKMRCVFQRRKLSTRPTARLHRWRESELEIWCMCHARIVAQPRRRPGARTYLSSGFWLCLLTLAAKGENRALEFKWPRPSISQGVLCGPSAGVCLEACRDKATDGLGSAQLAVVGLVLSPVVGTRQELIANPHLEREGDHRRLLPTETELPPRRGPASWLGRR
jgi:hypothetical protein